MNLTERLLKIDTKKFDEIPTKQIKSNVLSGIVGEDVLITIKATDSTRLLELSKKANNHNEETQLEAMKLICSIGIVDPDLKSVELKTKFGLDEKSTPIQVIDKLWGVRKLELIEIAKEVMQLNGLSTKDEEVKN